MRPKSTIYRGRSIAKGSGLVWWPLAAAHDLRRIGDTSLAPDLAAIVQEFRARYRRYYDRRINPGNQDIKENLHRLMEKVSDAEMLQAVRALDSSTIAVLKFAAWRACLRDGQDRAQAFRLRDTSMHDAPLVGGPARIRTLAQAALAEFPPDPGGQRAPKLLDLQFAYRLVRYWNETNKQAAVASEIPTPFMRFFQAAFPLAERKRELDVASYPRLIRQAIRHFK